MRRPISYKERKQYRRVLSQYWELRLRRSWTPGSHLLLLRPPTSYQHRKLCRQATSHHRGHRTQRHFLHRKWTCLRRPLPPDLVAVPTSPSAVAWNPPAASSPPDLISAPQAMSTSDVASSGTSNTATLGASEVDLPASTILPDLVAVPTSPSAVAWNPPAASSPPDLISAPQAISTSDVASSGTSNTATLGVSEADLPASTILPDLVAVPTSPNAVAGSGIPTTLDRKQTAPIPSTASIDMDGVSALLSLGGEGRRVRPTSGAVRVGGDVTSTDVQGRRLENDPFARNVPRRVMNPL